MGWDRVIGQEHAKDLLRRAVKAGHVAHAYLFEGPAGVGKDALAIEIARALNCMNPDGSGACGICASCKRMETLQHPNVRIIFALPAGKGEKTGDDPLKGLTEEQMESVQEAVSRKARDPYYRISIPKSTFIKVNSIREIRRLASLTSAGPGRKIFIILNAEEMNAEASNSLLKTLEEPPGDTVLLLTTSRREQLLPTIVSRCQVIRCEPLTESDIADALVSRDGIAREEAAVMARLANGSYGDARALASEDMLRMRTEVVQFLRLALGTSRVSLLGHLEGILTGRERPDAERWLRLLQIWLHDALAVQSNGKSGDEDMKRFLEKFPAANLLGASSDVERSIALVGKNVYLPLIFTALAIDLRHRIASPDP